MLTRLSVLNRTSSQKPGDDLLANFRQQFPQIAAGSTAAASTSQTATAGNPDAAPGDHDRYVKADFPPPLLHCLRHSRGIYIYIYILLHKRLGGWLALTGHLHPVEQAGSAAAVSPTPTSLSPAISLR